MLTNMPNAFAQAVVGHVVGKALQAGVNAVLVPTQLLLGIGTSVATSAATFLIMTAAQLTLNGVCYAGTKTIDGVKYFFYTPSKPLNEEWDDCGCEKKPKQ